MCPETRFGLRAGGRKDLDPPGAFFGSKKTQMLAGPVYQEGPCRGVRRGGRWGCGAVLWGLVAPRRRRRCRRRRTDPIGANLAGKGGGPIMGNEWGTSREMDHAGQKKNTMFDPVVLGSTRLAAMDAWIQVRPDQTWFLFSPVQFISLLVPKKIRTA